MEVRMKGFDMTGQFEDVTIQGLQPYENLTHSVVTSYVIYLLSKPNPTKQEITFCHQMLRWIEDQFVYWRCDLNEYGYRRDALPGVYEQYKYRNPIDHSAASVARAFYLYHKQTGDKLALAKSVAIADNIANNQYCFTGEMPTSFRRAYDQFVGDWWMNCALCSIETLLIINR